NPQKLHPQPITRSGEGVLTRRKMDFSKETISPIDKSWSDRFSLNTFRRNVKPVDPLNKSSKLI
ncbi:MAG: hypothetical protein K2Q18_13940, partial [Bdellovibrionales bacterium]|nr:hypothetical protein [Bdellovibrionales bacterium]